MASMRAHSPRSPRGRLLGALHWSGLVILGLGLLLLLMVRVAPVAALYPSLPRITHTAHGAAGDPVNILLVGSQTQITASFIRAHWLVPDPITPETAARIAADSLAHRPYPTAPVSNLYVFGRVQDLAFEWPTADVQNRGHIRLWRTKLQLDGQPVWLGAASYDQGIELSGTTGLPTHHISPTVDLERDTVGTDLQRTGLVAAEAYDPYTAPIFVAYNGGGDYFASDGEVLLIAYSRAALPLPAPTGPTEAVAVLTRGLFRGYDAMLTALPLAVVATLAGVVLLVLLVLVLWPVLGWLWRQVRPRLR